MPFNQQTKVDLDAPVSRKRFPFKVARFWSSPECIPGLTIIANVLFNPSDHDVHLIVDYFGRESVIESYRRLREDPDFRVSAKRICERCFYCDEQGMLPTGRGRD